MLTVIVLSAAFTVDLGMQRVVRADVQRVADVVALDMAREIRGRTVAEIQADATAWDAALAAATARNSDILGDAPTVTYRLVDVDPTTGAVSDAATADVPDGVEVSASGSVSFAFRPGSGGATRTAVAAAEPQACFSVGSYVAGVDTNDAAVLDAVLGEVLGTGVSTSLVGYQGLATADVSALAVAQEVPALSALLTAGSREEVLDTQVGVGTLVTAIVAAANRDSTLSSQALALGASLAAHASALGTISLGELLGVTGGGTAALTAEVNALDLLVSTVQVANGEYFLDASDIALSTAAVPGTSSLASLGLTGDLHAIPAPSTSCGPVGTTADTASVSLDDLTLAATVTPLSLAGLTSVTVDPVGLTLDADTARATAQLTDVECVGDTGTAEGIDAAVASTAVALSAALEPVGVHATASLTLGPLSLPVTLTFELELSPEPSLATVPAGYGAAQSFRSPPGSYGTAMSFGSGSLIQRLDADSLTVGGNVVVTVAGVDTALQLTDGVLTGTAPTGLSLSLLQTAANPLLGTIVNGVGSVPGVLEDVVNPLLETVNGLLAGPLHDALGLTIAGADVYPLPSPDCDDIALRG
ncbi:hypothetical protein [Nocardioides sp. GY 10127]|uniref:hypothetical protein n=1 Tax=Nocardioides sp. GY 10127 TaxID=2569762 RepID=UPI0010A826C8|nr:hypothetical protein [Nocardioides sp. GY 10127]TIC80851.1 hypothetical protein E8D37_13455 [Nocardioides sp. GY 10127]